MYYIFVVNGRPDRSYILQDLERQLEQVDIKYEIYVTAAVGDATRFVNVHCDLNPDQKECFVACGGSGTVNEVASGLVGKNGKYLAVLSYGGTNDILKSLPERDYTSVASLIDGDSEQIDIIKINDSYALNVANIGFDATVALKADYYSAKGMDNPYKRGLLYALLHSRFHKLNISVDGGASRTKHFLLGTFANGKYCGGEFMCAPRAKCDDGLMEVCIIRIVTLLEFVLILSKYRKGKHLDDRFCRKRITYFQASEVELKSNEMIFISLDGEVVALPEWHLKVIPKAINLIIPKR